MPNKTRDSALPVDTARLFGMIPLYCLIVKKHTITKNILTID